MANQNTIDWHLSANLGFLWKDLPFAGRISAAAAAGFSRVEFHDDVQTLEVDKIAALIDRLELTVCALNCRSGSSNGTAAIPGREDTASRDFDAALAAADACGAAAIHVLSGRTDEPEALVTLARNLADFADRTDRILLIEPISAAAIPGYALRDIEQAAEVLDRVGKPNLRIMFDTYHIAQEGHDLARAFTGHAKRVGHVQISDPITRHEPAADVMGFLSTIRDYGYHGAIGCEYVPANGEEAGLSWRSELPAAQTRHWLS